MSPNGNEAVPLNICEANWRCTCEEAKTAALWTQKKEKVILPLVKMESERNKPQLVTL